MHQFKPPPDDARVAKQSADLFGAGVRGDVEIFRAAMQQQIAHATADQMRLEAAGAQAVNHLQRGGANPTSVKPKFGGGINNRFHNGAPCAATQGKRGEFLRNITPI